MSSGVTVISLRGHSKNALRGRSENAFYLIGEKVIAHKLNLFLTLPSPVSFQAKPTPLAVFVFHAERQTSSRKYTVHCSTINQSSITDPSWISIEHHGTRYQNFPLDHKFQAQTNLIDDKLLNKKKKIL